eukprot:Seg932.2 transcript_id=Seg932.2/GoldUCD/mRNA.D3Y31 product="putative RNA-directed DNA polymerase from transposon BS" pseudo=true protein_id=Seg932.2/GoldUCD/D3Y31
MSTELAVTFLTDYIREQADSGNLTGALYIDLSKAFDTISHSVLLNKLPSDGITDGELGWFTDYLFLRKQSVEINRAISNAYPVYTGVPQGSILGPLLFLLHMNDIGGCLKHSSIITYADDTVLFTSSKCVHDIERGLNEDINSVHSWLNENELILNLKKGKTEAMLFGTGNRLSLLNGKQLEIHVDGQLINSTTSYKYLGVHLDPTLTLATHFDKTCKKAGSRVNMMRKIRNSLTSDAAEALYRTMVLPIFTYCGTLSLGVPASRLKKIQSIEKRGKNIIASTLRKNMEIRIPSEIEVESVYSRSPDNEDAAQTCQGATNSVKKSTSLENDPATVPTPVVVNDFERDDAVPPGLVPVTATGNGDCLFNSIGKLLFGSETVTPILRLVAAVLAVSHFKHYVEEYRERYLTRDCALQMLYSLSTPGVYERRPSFARKNASDVLRYAISSEIMEITKEKTFSGLLHVRFLATILSRSINLHCSYNDFYHGMMMPCLCSCDQLHDAINVMFVSVGRSVCPNHYIPLVWKIGTRSGAPALEESKHKQLCAATKLLGCQAIGEERQNWVSCRRCRLPYHAACSGIAAQRKEFVCCLDVETQELIRNDIHAIGLHFYDRSCLLQNVIARKVSKVFVADTNQSKDIIENKRTATKIFPRDDLLDNDVLIFPYAITSCWHWVVAVLSLKDKWMCVLDSLNATGGSDRRLQYFERFVNLLQVQKRKDVTKFHEINCKIPVQERPDDCGVFTLYYAEKLMKEEYHIDETYGIVIQDLFNIGETLRKKIIRHMYDCQKKT